MKINFGNLFFSTKNKFAKDVLWNIFSYGGIVLIGILINIIIVKFYDEEALGVFNQTYAIYIFLSQLAVGGIHLSIQYFVPRYAQLKKYHKNFLVTALISSLITSVIVITAGYLAIPVFSHLLNSKPVEHSLYLTLWGLLFFSLNKVLLSFHNGLRNMKTFAVFQLLRFVFMLMTLLYFMSEKYSMVHLASVLSYAEVFLFILLFFSLKRYLHFQITERFKKIFKIQFIHGLKSLIGNFLLDLNTKVDIFMLGMFMTDAAVGVYSFAATFFEGFSQIAVLLRNNFNPVITRTFSNKELFVKIMRKNIASFYKIISYLGILSLIGVSVIVFLLNMENSFEIITIYALLLAGFMLTSGYQVLLMIFNQTGLPQIQTLFIFVIFISNVIFNFIFIPLFDTNGAAIGTSFSFITTMLFIKGFFKKKYHLNL